MTSVPTNKSLYNRLKEEGKRKFAVWPSVYGSAWLVKTYKKKGGKYSGKRKKSRRKSPKRKKSRRKSPKRKKSRRKSPKRKKSR